MIKIFPTIGRKDARAVELECTLVGFNRNRHWILLNSFHERLLIVLGNVFEACHGTLWEAHCARGCLARTTAAFVWVASLGADGIVFCIFEGGGHQASIAAFVHFVTIYELLLAEGNELSSRDFPGAFQRARRRERPTRTTLALVLHWCHCA